MTDGMKYLEQFQNGLLEATGKKVAIKHAFARFRFSTGKSFMFCEVDGIRELPRQKTFMVSIKAIDKPGGLFVVAKGQAMVKSHEVQDDDLYRLQLQVHINDVTAYRKEPDESGNELLVALCKGATSNKLTGADPGRYFSQVEY